MFSSKLLEVVGPSKAFNDSLLSHTVWLRVKPDNVKNKETILPIGAVIFQVHVTFGNM